MDDLAREMGVSKKTLYQHFPAKRALLEAAITAKLDDLTTRLDAIDAGTPSDFPATLQRLLETLRQSVGEISPSFVRDLAREDPTLTAHIKVRRREVVTRTFARILLVGQRAGRIRSDIPASFLIDVLVSLADTLATPESFVLRGIPPHEIIRTLLSLFLEGALTRPDPAAP